MLNVLSPLARLDVLATPRQGAPLRVTIGGVTYERVTIDGAFASLDGQPIYMQVS